MGCSDFKKIRDFYDSLYKGEVYSRGDFHGDRLSWWQSNFQEKVSRGARILEIGCGRGHLQHLAPGYVGLDISLEAGRFLAAPFVCGVAEALPFADGSFDLVMSFTLLEHLWDPELALKEMARVLKKGGTLVVGGGWRVPPWKPLGLDLKSYRGLSLGHKIVKALLPLLNYCWTRGIFRLPLRALRELRFLKGKDFHSLPYTRITPNWEEYLAPDSDATVSMDNHACALWLRSRGFVSPDTQSPWQRLRLRCRALVMEKT